ncbi:MAG: lipoyl(octanoyl) transferase LipB [Bacteroidia bacterium]|nr:lipoyl(octanoyl) transferase LipB [Bacteroidia bacterium]
MKNKVIKYLDLGISEYKHTWDKQEELLNQIVEIKKANSSAEEGEAVTTPNYLIFVEHPHVYTLGKSGDEHNLLLNYIQLQAKDAGFFKTDRGGDITYHGPGQIVGYPILDLENFGMGLRQYIYSIEEAIIHVVASYGITAARDPHATGVWLDVGKPTARKICAIGVKSSRFVTMHGFALNINTDLEYFKHINPCGFSDKGVTSLEKELGSTQDFELAKELVLEKFTEVFGSTFV